MSVGVGGEPPPAPRPRPAAPVVSCFFIMLRLIFGETIFTLSLLESFESRYAVMVRFMPMPVHPSIRRGRTEHMRVSHKESAD